MDRVRSRWIILLAGLALVSGELVWGNKSFDKDLFFAASAYFGSAMIGYFINDWTTETHSKLASSMIQAAVQRLAKKGRSTPADTFPHLIYQYYVSSDAKADRYWQFTVIKVDTHLEPTSWIGHTIVTDEDGNRHTYDLDLLKMKNVDLIAITARHSSPERSAVLATLTRGIKGDSCGLQLHEDWLGRLRCGPSLLLRRPIVDKANPKKWPKKPCKIRDPERIAVLDQMFLELNTTELRIDRVFDKERAAIG